MVAFQKFLSRFSWDVVGFSASALCAIHCAVVPIVVLYSSFASNLVHNHTVENVILVFSAGIGVIALVPSFRRHHRKPLPLMLFSIGVMFIVSSRFQSAILVETILTTGGALLIAMSHILNWKLCKPFHTPQRSRG